MSIESVMPSNRLILCCPLLLLPSIFPSIRVFSSESALHIRWPKYWSFSFSISPSNEYSELISFRIDWFDRLAVHGTLKSLLQHHSSKAPILWCSAVFMVQLSLLYMTTGKTLALTTWIFVVKYYVYFTTVFKHHNYRALGETYIWTEENAAGQGKADKRTAFFPVLVPHRVLRHHFTSSPVLQPGTVISNILSAAKWEHMCLRACDVMESPLWGKQVHRASAKSPTSSRLDSRGGPGRGLNAALCSQFVNATFGSWLLFSVLEEEEERCVWLRPIFCFLLVCWDQVVASDTENVLLCLNSRDHPQIHRMVGGSGVGL